jgi:deazaflavin-dependent oxidoreductase (nitroreductase family)
MRAPVWLYRARLGFLLTGRMLMLTHVGRRTGRVRRTVLEVVGHDPCVPEWYVVSGFGPGADWLLNIQAGPALRVDVGREHFTPVVRFLGRPERERLLLAYTPRLAQRLPAVGLRPA